MGVCEPDNPAAMDMKKNVRELKAYIGIRDRNVNSTLSKYIFQKRGRKL